MAWDDDLRVCGLWRAVKKSENLFSLFVAVDCLFSGHTTSDVTAGTTAESAHAVSPLLLPFAQERLTSPDLDWDPDRVCATFCSS